MKKITRMDVEALKREMPILDVREQKGVIGGGHLYIISENGVITYSSVTPGTDSTIVIGSIDSGKVYSFSGNINMDDFLNGYKLSGDAVNKKLFEFLALNTNVEWGMCENSKSGSAYIIN